jgi:hypothetical protein
MSPDRRTPSRSGPRSGPRWRRRLGPAPGAGTGPGMELGMEPGMGPGTEQDLWPRFREGSPRAAVGFELAPPRLAVLARVLPARAGIRSRQARGSESDPGVWSLLPQIPIASAGSSPPREHRGGKGQRMAIPSLELRHRMPAGRARVTEARRQRADPLGALPWSGRVCNKSSMCRAFDTPEGS